MVGWEKFADKLVEPIAGLLSEFITDKDERNRLASKLAELSAQHAHDEQMQGLKLQEKQIEVNNTSAKSTSVFVAGARPFIIWVCGFSLIFNYMVVPLIGIFSEITPMDTTHMIPILGGLLGFGSLRTVEKVKGVARDAL